MNRSSVAIQPDGSLMDQEVEPELNLAAAKRRLNPLVLAVIGGLAAVFVFASIDLYLCTDLTLMINDRFMGGTPFIPGGYLSYLDLLVIGTSFLLLERFGVHFLKTRLILRFFFVFAASCVLLDLLNPNDEASKILGIPLLANVKAFAFLLFMFSVFFIREEGFLVTIRRATFITAGIVIARTIILLILWVMGKGNYKFGGMGSSLSEGDSLMVFAFFAVLFLALFLIRRRAVYLLFWILLIALQVLSFRRSALYIVIGSSAFVLLLHLLTKGRLGAFVRNVAVSAFVLIVAGLIVVQTIPEEMTQHYFNRYFGVFLGMGQGGREAYAGDSGHFSESAVTLAYAFDKMDFWGYGGGEEDRINIPGATERRWVHNIFAGSWLYHGVYQFVFYVFLLCVTLLMGMKIFFQRRRYDQHFVLLMGSIVGFMVMMMVIWYTNPIQLAESLKMRIFWTTLLACIFRITPSNYTALLGEQEQPPAGAVNP